MAPASAAPAPGATDPLEGWWREHGITRIRLPFPGPLGHSFCYLVETDEGLVVVDSGWESDEGWDAFAAGVAAAGHTLADIDAVVLTHAHPDHGGLAGRIRDAAAAWVGMHHAEVGRTASSSAQVESNIADLLWWMVRAGAPSSEVLAVEEDRPNLRRRYSRVQADGFLADEEDVRGSGRLVAIHTPGHTPGHLCFFDRRSGALFTGDHVLPRITPSVSMRPPPMGINPLGEYRASLTRIHSYGAAIGLPGHEGTIRNLAARVEELQCHHDRRLAEVLGAVGDQPRTTWDLASAVSWSRSWDATQGTVRRAAVGETLSHLTLLMAEGRIRYHEGPPDRWSIV